MLQMWTIMDTEFGFVADGVFYSELNEVEFNFPEGGVEIYAERVNNRGLNAQTQAESLKYKLLGGLAVRRACYGVLRFVMESGAKGAEVSVSGKVRGQRAKSQKFSDGYMIKTGHAYNEYVETAVRHVMMRQGILGVKVAIMLPHDPKGIQGPKVPIRVLGLALSTNADDDDPTPWQQAPMAAAAAVVVQNGWCLEEENSPFDPMMMILEAAAVAMTLREEGVGASAVRSKPVASVLPRMLLVVKSFIQLLNTFMDLHPKKALRLIPENEVSHQRKVFLGD
eukprot:gene18001-18238_t